MTMGFNQIAFLAVLLTFAQISAYISHIYHIYAHVQLSSRTGVKYCCYAGSREDSSHEQYLITQIS